MCMGEVDGDAKRGVGRDVTTIAPYGVPATGVSATWDRTCGVTAGQSGVRCMLGQASHRVKRFFRVADAMIEARWVNQAINQVQMGVHYDEQHDTDSGKGKGKGRMSQ